MESSTANNYKLLCDKIASILLCFIDDDKNNKSKEIKEDIFTSDNDIESNEYFTDIFHSLATSLELEEASVINTLVLVDTFLRDAKNINLRKNNVLLITLIAMIISLKFLEDVIFSNKTIAKFSGISIEDIALMEISFLEIIDYRILISDKAYNCYKEYILE